jgi:ornithine carbamoyltransferase
MNLQGRNLLKETDLSAAEFLDLVGLGERLRLQKRMGIRASRLASRNIALIFEKTSTRTRSAFEVAAHDEGAHVTYLGPEPRFPGRIHGAQDRGRVPLRRGNREVGGHWAAQRRPGAAHRRRRDLHLDDGRCVAA